mmetsp:Transcript_71633/g.210359  ORF Transcript_71633/g.210359 Transcript_71633/m.210359 type:complete len:324 (-) Transcript_71633:132-1103(-)
MDFEKKKTRECTRWSFEGARLAGCQPPWGICTTADEPIHAKNVRGGRRMRSRPFPKAPLGRTASRRTVRRARTGEPLHRRAAGGGGGPTHGGRPGHGCHLRCERPHAEGPRGQAHSPGMKKAKMMRWKVSSPSTPAARLTPGQRLSRASHRRTSHSLGSARFLARAAAIPSVATPSKARCRSVVFSWSASAIAARAAPLGRPASASDLSDLFAPSIPAMCMARTCARASRGRPLGVAAGHTSAVRVSACRVTLAVSASVSAPTASASSSRSPRVSDRSEVFSPSAPAIACSPGPRSTSSIRHRSEVFTLSMVAIPATATGPSS